MNGRGGDVKHYHRERPPWRPERGQYIRIWGTSLAIPEWAGFVIALAVCAALLAVSLAAF